MCSAVHCEVETSGQSYMDLLSYLLNDNHMDPELKSTYPEADTGAPKVINTLIYKNTILLMAYIRDFNIYKH